jgi:FkbM family methyltransferase
MIEPVIHQLNLLNIDPKTILDIGSRDLDQSIEFRQRFKDAKILAFEPNPQQKNICQEKAARHNIDFYSIAISKIDGIIEFNAVDPNCKDPNIGASSILNFSDELVKQSIKRHSEMPVQTNKIKVESRNLDNFLNEKGITNIDVIWMDVQGLELEILKSSPIIISNTRLIHLESEFRTIYKDQPLYPEIKEYLESIGFKEVYNRQEYRPEYKNWDDFNYPSDTDSIFINLNEGNRI